MEDAGDVQKALEGKGIELTLDEIRRIKERAIKAQSGEAFQDQPEPLANGELSEDELMEVAGGEGESGLDTFLKETVSALMGAW